MWAIDLILKLIEDFHLVPSDKLKQLVTDCDDWARTATKDSKNKLKSAYAKAHEGIALRLALPFVFFYLRSMFASWDKEKEEDIF